MTIENEIVNDFSPEKKLIVGLGNPGPDYQFTRHNLGYLVVKELANRHGLRFRRERKMFGHIAEGFVFETKFPIYLLLPTTYMNRSGKAIKCCIDFFKLSLCDLLVVYDDIAYPLGCIKLRASGGANGHNGLKSIEQIWGNQYNRLRMGIGDNGAIPLEEYVLDNFSAEEKEALLPQAIDNGVKAIECWLKEGIDIAMNRVNAPNSKSSFVKPVEEQKEKL